MSKDEYISIAEFARRAGVTPQAVYKQLNNQVDNQLTTYVKIMNGKKRLHVNALKIFLSTNLNRVDNQFNNQVDNFSQPVVNQVDNQNSQIIGILREQIERKDAQIEQLQEDLRTSREEYHRLATEMAKIADQGQQLQLRMMLPDGQPHTQQPEAPGDPAASAAAPIHDADVIDDEDTPSPIDELAENHPSSINWWMIVAIAVIIALIAGGCYYLWNLGYIQF